MAENSIEGRKSLDIEIIKARDIQVPVRPVEDFLTPELLKARSAFLAGRDISRDDLARTRDRVGRRRRRQRELQRLLIFVTVF